MIRHGGTWVWFQNLQAWYRRVWSSKSSCRVSDQPRLQETLSLLNKKWKKGRNNDYSSFLKKEGEREFFQWCHQWWLLKCRQQAWWLSSTFCAMKRLCLGKLSHASICSDGWSHRTVGNILKAEWFLCFSWKNLKDHVFCYKTDDFFFNHWWHSYRESLQSCTQLNTDTTHNDVKKTIEQLSC